MALDANNKLMFYYKVAEIYFDTYINLFLYFYYMPFLMVQEYPDMFKPSATYVCPR